MFFTPHPWAELFTSWQLSQPRQILKIFRLTTPFNGWKTPEFTKERDDKVFMNKKRCKRT